VPLSISFASAAPGSAGAVLGQRICEWVAAWRAPWVATDGRRWGAWGDLELRRLRKTCVGLPLGRPSTNDQTVWSASRDLLAVLVRSPQEGVPTPAGGFRRFSRVLGFRFHDASRGRRSGLPLNLPQDPAGRALLPRPLARLLARAWHVSWHVSWPVLGPCLARVWPVFGARPL